MCPNEEEISLPTFLNVSSVECSTITSRDTTSEQADFIQGSLGVDLGDGNFSTHGVLTERAGAHEVEEVLSLTLETNCTIRHQTLAWIKTICIMLYRIQSFDFFGIVNFMPYFGVFRVLYFNASYEVQHTASFVEVEMKGF